ncbi:deoxyguanosinetriphosphate triphosphohydrolase-like protein [Elysia marginata]|uniref:Deoxyguanosinetriphosphate triphosphohydrolase-like protein n=1 Tax=Elysia marginata TaxID=1093978 RepID=A0AAV4G5Q0_9GAST|nr:deoxyguanosinetriphosphate triphosphohydrolase-like protein [Elysia marginata]
MDWEQLLSLRRYGDKKKRTRRSENEIRLGFEVDYDRVIFSSDFRSLQDKTQVFPFSKTDFVHTRLTHSLEVSVVGRSLGRKAGKEVLCRYPNLSRLGYKTHDFGSIVATASLAHDIGNPPFGHGGECAMGNFFETGKGASFKRDLIDKEFADLASFEGNANGFKILTDSREGVEGGLRLTYATLGAFTKYPKESLPKKPTDRVMDKKFGFFQSEKEQFKNISSDLGLMKSNTNNYLSYQRHPLAYLVEAADDICYTIIDFEDGINLGLIPEEYALEYLSKLVGDSLYKSKYSNLKTKPDRIGYLRAIAIQTLIDEATAIFLDNEMQILNGNFDSSLLEHSRFSTQLEDIVAISRERLYHSVEVTEKEISGQTILRNLLEGFTKAYQNSYLDRPNNMDKLILRLLPERYLYPDNLYKGLLNICSYIAGLSDGKVTNLYSKLSGSVF